MVQPGGGQAREVAVIITARNAERTAAMAVASALHQAPAREVVFVDDGSTDATAQVAAGADDGSGRLNIIRLPENRGPSAGRNVAIAASMAPWICILDADDFMAPGRLAAMFEQAGEDCDLIADDITFCRGPDAASAFDHLLEPGLKLPLDLNLERFSLGNLPRADRPRRELGFLKPLMRREFLAAHGLGYDERLRLGEDFILYSACMIAGARFRLVQACGYCAVQYDDSLSARHRTEDVERLHAALVELARTAAAAGAPLSGLDRVRRHQRDNLALRRALDGKRAQGWRGLISAVGASPESLPFIVGRIAHDKLAARSPAKV